MDTKTYLHEISHTIDRPVHKNHLITTTGLWIDGKTYWVQNGSEKLMPNESLSIHIKQESLHSKVKFYELSITNHSSIRKKMKLLIMHHYEKPVKESLCFVSPSDNLIFHLHDHEVYLVNGQFKGSLSKEFTVQPYWNIYTDHLWSSPDSGTLKYQPMAKGLAASILSMNVDISPHQSGKGSAWVIMGEEKEELIRLNTALLKKHTSISN